ncbi:cobalamin-binding protein [Chroococcus sp. FPU101]|uniref:cobalamin-binding protein n=1 Tax=Chroococcus sp. FPU101 TaxID=1974212 RepID=UPI001A8E9775|nr:cobalamin-binding protein [Chroococcus sp. FPU101]GFE69718.1 putative iron transport system substrate-binding protein [Chroococcus sp. FPU101]
MNPKIITLLPSATEIIYALGLTEHLVGRSHECDYPLEVQSLPVCTSAKLNTQRSSLQIDTDVQSLIQSALSIYQIETEIIEKLQPTHIITQDQCDVCAVSFPDVKKAVDSLVSSHPEIISLQPNLLDEVWDDIKRVAQALDVPYQNTLQELDKRIESITSKTKNILEKNQPSVVALEWIEPLMGAGNWIPELIEMAGGKSVLGSSGQYSPYINWDELLKANPDVIIIMPCGFDLERTHQEAQVLKNHSDWKNLQAVQQNKVYLTDGNAYFNRPGPRLVDSLEILAEILHPELFAFGYHGKAWEVFS